MLSLWKAIRRRECGVPRHHIQLRDVTDITYEMVALYYKAWTEIVDAFNQATGQTPVHEKPMGQEGLHIYLKHGAEFHVYPVDRNHIYVLFVQDGITMTYKAECEPLYLWFAKRTSHTPSLNQRQQCNRYSGELAKGMQLQNKI